MMWQIDPDQGVNFFLVGVGGQGTILASDVLAEIGIKLGYDVKKAEIHGMSQRGGSVVSNLRWGRQVFSPIITFGTADILIAFEKMEAVRFLPYLKADGLILVNDTAIEPITVSSGKAIYPTDEQIRENLSRVSKHIYWVDGGKIAEKAGNIKAANTAMLGALTALLGLSDAVAIEAISSRVPGKYIDVNKTAFEAGKKTFE
jgi:indolepyruvate ferredoxin oxidoreductase, beta subunit